MDLADHPLRTAEFLVVDTETNGYGGERCEMTEVGAVVVGGGELHDRFASLCAVRAPLSRGVQRLTGITNTMLDEAPEADIVLADLIEQLEGRVLVGHNVAFDRRVLAQACERAGLAWPDPPALCTVAGSPDTSGCHHSSDLPSARRRYAHVVGSHRSVSALAGSRATHSCTKEWRSA